MEPSATDLRDQHPPLDRVMHLAAFRAGLRAFQRRTERIARHWALTPRQYLLLLMIEGAPDGSRRANLTDLAGRLQLSPSAVTELCDRAELAGLVEREPSEHDGRFVYLRLTREGDRRLSGSLRELDADRAEIVAAFEELAATFGEAPAGAGAREP